MNAHNTCYLLQIIFIDPTHYDLESTNSTVHSTKRCRSGPLPINTRNQSRHPKICHKVWFDCCLRQKLPCLLSLFTSIICVVLLCYIFLADSCTLWLKWKLIALSIGLLTGHYIDRQTGQPSAAPGKNSKILIWQDTDMTTSFFSHMVSFCIRFCCCTYY